MKIKPFIQAFTKAFSPCQNSKSHQKKQFNPNRLPSPTTLYGRFGIHIRHDGWQSVKCPFHDDKHASMGVNGTHGGYYCHACKASGNLIGFYMQMTNTDYKTAMMELGAYD